MIGSARVSPTYTAAAVPFAETTATSYGAATPCQLNAPSAPVVAIARLATLTLAPDTGPPLPLTTSPVLLPEGLPWHAKSATAVVRTRDAFLVFIYRASFQRRRSLCQVGRPARFCDG